MPNTRFYSLAKYLQEQLEKEPSAFPWRLIEDGQRGELLLQFFIANPAGESKKFLNNFLKPKRPSLNRSSFML